MGEVEQVAVIGAGTMGAGVAYVFAAAGCGVELVDADAGQAASAVRTIEHQAQRARDKGKLDAAAAEALPSRVRTRAAIDDLPGGLDLIVEAVPERAELKREVLAAAEAREPGVLASNTSGISIDELAVGLARPKAFLGLHFFNPVWAMPLLEIIHGTATGEDVVRWAQRTGELIGKETILVRDVPGFATSRLGIAIGLEGIRMLEEGVASAEDIDKAMELGYKHPMGPLRLTDLVGLDVRLDIARHLAHSHGPRFEPPQLLADKVAAGETGKKTGKGFYDW